MFKKDTEKSQRQHLKVILYLIAVITVAMVIEILILNSFNKKNSNRTSLVLLNQVKSIIEDNEKNEDELIESLKEIYMIRAQTISYILDSKPEAEYDVQELQKIAGLMQVDEIHLFDETGKIYSGSEPKYYGYNFESGEQMAYFKPMLEDKSLTMCQEVTPNTAEGKNMMYAITWNESGDRMVQVGIEPLRLLEELQNNEISKVIANMPAYEGINILVADAESGEICATTESDMIDKNLNEIGIIETTTETDTTVSKVLEIEGHRNYCNFTNTGEYIIVVACAASASVKNFIVPMVIEFVYLMLASVIIVYTLNRLLKANDERDTQMAVLASMSDIYNSMHLIDLERNTVVEYNARFNVSETEGADRVLKELITLKTEEDYCEDALVFTDIHTITDRMQNKKIISEEFMSKDIGWYRSSFITIETNEEGYPTKVIYVTQNIDKQKKKEEELIFKSNVDELTGLYNRRAYDEDVEEHNGIVTEEDFVFVSLDVNGLKTVNDGMGHVAGDDLLIGAANCMKQCFEPYGKVYRVGGDEFIAIIFANEIQLQSIKRSFEEATDKWTGNLVDSLSVSCGYVAKREVNTTSIREIANMADKKMYKVKSEFYRRSAK